MQVSSAITIDPALVSASYVSPFITNLTFDEQSICLRTNVKAYGISCMYWYWIESSENGMDDTFWKRFNALWSRSTQREFNAMIN